MKYKSVLLEATECCGCLNCYNKCGSHAIKLEKNEFGFIYPFIDTERCVDCGLCTKVCPILSKPESIKTPRKVFAAFASNEQRRDEGSSGGIFGVLARQVIVKRGIVFGAAFDSSFRLHHVSASTIEELIPLFKSKYVESSLGNVFFEVEYWLKKGRQTLFCGTPCQCNALKTFLRKEYDNLLLVDILCHGVPSQDFLDKAIQEFERRHNGRLKSFSFRMKKINQKSDHLYSLMYESKSGKSITIDKQKAVHFPYYNHYLTYRGFRPSCYQCKFATLERATDLTLGDFWGLSHVMQVNDFYKGYSIVISHNNQGENVLKELGNQIKMQEVPLENITKYNVSTTTTTTKPMRNEEFCRDYLHYPYHLLEKKWMITKTDILHKGGRFIKRLIKHFK